MPPRKEIEEIGEVGTSATGQLLQQIVAKMNEIKSGRDISDALSKELKEIANKVKDHEISISVVAKAMEDMNVNAKEFNDILKEMQKDTQQYLKDSQLIFLKMESILEHMAKYEPRFEKIEQRQIDGCPSSLSARQAIMAEMKHQDAITDSLRKGVDKNREEIDTIRNRQDIALEQIKVANNRIGDLETFEKGFLAWKEKIYTAMIVYTLGLVGAVVSAVWGVITK